MVHAVTMQTKLFLGLKPQSNTQQITTHRVHDCCPLMVDTGVPFFHQVQLISILKRLLLSGGCRSFSHWSIANTHCPHAHKDNSTQPSKHTNVLIRYLNPAWVCLLVTQPELFTMLSLSFHPMQLVITVTQEREWDGHLLNKASAQNKR